jgi:HCO3- transporter integral membrane domain
MAQSNSSLSSGLPIEKPSEQGNDLEIQQDNTVFEKEFHQQTETTYSAMLPRSKIPLKQRLKQQFGPGGKLRPFRLLKQDLRNIKRRYLSDWTTFNQLVFASAVYVFFTNILPGITFASDLYVLTGMTWGTIEVVFSTGLCGIIFSL